MNGGADEYFIGSADCMKRNLESRVEAVAPVEDPTLRKELRAVFDLQLKPNHAAWEMRSDGSYVRLPGDWKNNCQLGMIDVVEKREKEEEKTRRARRLRPSRDEVAARASRGPGYSKQKEEFTL